jgi:hypothetical protein
VRDSGPGIALDEQAKLFRYFAQGGGQRATAAPIGLPSRERWWNHGREPLARKRADGDAYRCFAGPQVRTGGTTHSPRAAGQPGRAGSGPHEGAGGEVPVERQP